MKKTGFKILIINKVTTKLIASLMLVGSTVLYAQTDDKNENASQGIVAEISQFVGSLPGGHFFTNIVKILKNTATSVITKGTGKSITYEEYISTGSNRVSNYQLPPQFKILGENETPLAWSFNEIDYSLENEYSNSQLVETLWYPIRSDFNKKSDGSIWFARLHADSSAEEVDFFAYDLTKVHLAYVFGQERMYINVNKRMVPVLASGSSQIPKEIGESNRLLAAFRGGFRFTDGITPSKQLFGSMENGVVQVPLSEGLLGVGTYTDGKVVLEKYNPNRKYRHFRQNGLPIIENGTVTEAARTNEIWYYGSSLNRNGVGVKTSRHAIGMDPTGRWLIIAKSSYIDLYSLALSMEKLGLMNAILLDENLKELSTHAIYQNIELTGAQYMKWLRLKKFDVPSIDFVNQKYSKILFRDVFYGYNYKRDLKADAEAKSLRFIGRPEYRDFFYIYRK